MSTAHDLPVEYQINVPGTQKQGGYTGTVTYTATAGA